MANWIARVTVFANSGGSDYNGEEDSPIPKEREDENEKTRNKMKMLKEQMESLTIAKEKKVNSNSLLLSTVIWIPQRSG